MARHIPRSPSPNSGWGLLRKNRHLMLEYLDVIKDVDIVAQFVVRLREVHQSFVANSVSGVNLSQFTLALMFMQFNPAWDSVKVLYDGMPLASRICSGNELLGPC